MNHEERQLLSRAGLNVLSPGPAGRTRVVGSVTLGRGLEIHRDYTSLPVRRFCLQVANAIARATRWVVFESNDAEVVGRIREQVLTYLRGLDDLGAFVGSTFAVRCHAAAQQRSGAQENSVTIVLAFHPVGSEERVSLTLQLTPAGCRVGHTAFAPVVEQGADTGSDDFT